MRIEVIDLFCGVGGLSAGFRAEGVEVIAGIDVDESCKYAYEKNIGADFIPKSVSEVTAEQLSSMYSEGTWRVLVGCAPCQPFSMYTGRYRQNESEADIDKRWSMLDEFSRLIEGVRPDVVSMENVVRVANHPAFEEFISRIETAGYYVNYHKVRSQDYGVPQKRSRLVLFASKHGSVSLAAPSHAGQPVTVRQAIGDLPAIAAGTAHSDDRLHAARGLAPHNLRRLQATREGGSWKDWDEGLQLECHKRTGGKSFRAVYGRMNWDEPSPVITTQCLGIGNGRFGHPEQDRAISIREAAILQSFPADFEFVAPDSPVIGVHLARQIGNAVPPRLGRAVARSIKSHLGGLQQVAEANSVAEDLIYQDDAPSVFSDLPSVPTENERRASRRHNKGRIPTLRVLSSTAVQKSKRRRLTRRTP